MLHYQVENFLSIRHEAEALFRRHYAEIARLQHINILNMDWPRYTRLQAGGHLFCLTVRDTGKLVGYIVYILAPHLHYCESTQAENDLTYVLPEYRQAWAGYKLIKYAVQILGSRGDIDVVHMRVKKDHDWGKILKRLGFEEAEQLYSLALKKGGH